MFERFGNDLGARVGEALNWLFFLAVTPWAILAAVTAMAAMVQTVAGAFGVAVPWDVFGGVEAARCER